MSELNLSFPVAENLKISALLDSTLTLIIKRIYKLIHILTLLSKLSDEIRL